MGERRVRTLFKRVRNTIINSTTAAVLVTSSLGGALPVMLSGIASADNPNAPVNLNWSGPTVACGGATNSSTITANWGSVVGATSYNYRSWTTAAGSPYNSEATAYETDGLAGTSLAASFNQGQGQYSFEVQSVDSSNTASAWSAACSINYDTSLPTVSVTPVAGSTLSGTVTFHITINDVDPAAASNNHIFTYLYNTVAPVKSQGASIDLSSGTGTFTVDTTKLHDGIAWLDVGALGDGAGNHQTGDNYFKNYVIDNTAPAAPVISSPANNTVTTTANQQLVDWNDVSDPSIPVTYIYEAATDSNFNNIVYTSGSLSVSQIATPNTPEGDYYVRVKAVDGAGNSSAWSNVVHISVDNTAPVVSVTPVAGSLLHGTVTFHITATDAHPGNWSHVYVYLYDNGGTQKSKGASVDLSSGSADFTVDTTALDDGLATFDVGKLTDAAGNSTSVDVGHPNGADSYFKNYLIDNTAPKITVNSLFTHDSTPTVTGTVDDPTASISVQVHGHTYSATNNGDGTWSVDVTNHLADGVYDVQATATDAAGNVGHDSTTNELIVDTHPASTPILITPLDGSFTNDNTPLLSWLPSLTPNGPVGYEVEVATDSSFTNVVVDHLGSSLIYVSPSLSDGTYYVRVRGTDILGGQSGWSGTHKFTVDTSAPNVQITSPGNGAHVKNTVPVTGTFSDSNAVAYTWTVVDSHHHIVYFHLAGGSTVNPLSLSSFADGTYTITLEGFDAAGNHTSSTITIVIDDVAPTVAITGPSFTNDNTPTVTGTVDDNDASISINVGGHDYTGHNNGDGTWSADVTHHLNDGHYTVTVTATDLAGNVGTNTAQMTVDAHPASTPFLITPFNNSYTNDNTPFVSWLPSFTPNGPVTYDLQIATDNSFTNVVVDHSGNGLTFSPATALSDGTYYARVNATDHLGGQSSWSGVHEFTIDTVAPHVHIFRPHDGAFVRGTIQLRGFAYDSNPNRYSWVVTNSHNHIVFVQFLQTPPVTPVNWDTTTVADGTYTITLNDTDAAFNSSSDSVTVTVDNQAPTVSFVSPTDGQDVKGTIDVNVDVNDTNLSQYRLRLDGNLVQSDYHAVNGTETYSLDTTTLSDGSHTLKAAARDAAGNWASVTETIVVDNLAPTVTITDPTDFTQPFATGPSVTVTGSDATSGLNVLVTHIYDVATNTLQGVCGTASASELAAGSMTCDLSSLTDGSYYIKAGAFDNAGNNTTVTSPNFLIDRTAPTTPVATPVAGTYTSAQSVTLSSSDSGSGLAGIYYTTDGTTPNNTGNGTLYTGAISVNSSETIMAIAYDNAGNASLVLTASYTINIPSPTPPTTPTPNNDNNDTGNVLSTQTTTPSDQDNGNGQVKGASTDNKDSKQNTSNFLGLGWWWLLILAAILGFLWWLLGRRRKDEDES